MIRELCGSTGSNTFHSTNAINYNSNMAAFYKHICLWPDCGRKCSSLKELIDHIEVIHIERDPIELEKQEASQPAAIALSYVSCFFADRAAKKITKPDLGLQGGVHLNAEKKVSALKLPRKQASNEIDMDDDLCSISDAESEDSCNSWSTNASSCQEGEEFREGKRRFVCPVQGCGKRYKNINGIKYHTKNGHSRKSDVRPKQPKAIPRQINHGDEIKKGYRCHCGKVYKSQSGLRHHQNTQHGKKLGVGTKDVVSGHDQLHKKQLLAQVKHLNVYSTPSSNMT